MAEIVLVCGAGGFVGSHAIRELQRLGIEVVGAGCTAAATLSQQFKSEPFIAGDLHDKDFAARLVARVNPGKIVFAAGPADVQRSVLDPITDYINQVQPLIHVLRAASRLPQPPGVLLVSSAAVYGDAQTSPVPETARVAPISPYGFHKLAQEQLLHEFHTLYGLPVCTARAFSALGPGLRRLATWDITTRALKGDFTLRGMGHETRDYLDARDLGKALACIAVNAPFAGEIINVGSGEETPIRDFASLIYAALELDETPRFDGHCLSGSPLRWCADITRLRSLGFVRDFNLASAVSETVNWIRRDA